MAVLRPESSEQVREVLRIASAHSIAVYPISKGRNWGYGDASPLADNQVVLDLGRMNRILEVNTELAYAVIEPGVTQGQLYRYLTENKTRLWMDATGAGEDTSLVGNALDRGFGHTRYGDRILNTCGMEIILSDGRVLNTGFGHYSNAQAAHVNRYGIGPMLDGLFTQSNFGVVTRMGLWLMPEPEDFAAFFVSAPLESDLSELIDRLAPLRRQGLLQSAVHVANDLRTLSGRMRYPWDRAGGRTPLPEELRAQLRRECAVGAWNACGSISGTRETVAAIRKAVRRVLRGYRVTVLNDRGFRLAHSALGVLNRLGFAKEIGERLEIVKPLYGLLKGIPSNEPLRGAAWRVRGSTGDEPTDPLDCHAGLMWIAPALPATGAAATSLMRLIEPVYRSYQFDTLATFTMTNERALCCVTNIAFDRREVDDVARARSCYGELIELLMSHGYVPYRCGPETMPKLLRGSAGFWDVVADLKQALDPNGIIAPGRYQPWLT